MNNSASSHVSPTLPLIAQTPLAYVPFQLKISIIARTLNVIFAEPLHAGELDFLAHRAMNVFVTDANLRFSVRLNQGKLYVGNELADADAGIEGSIYTFLLLAARKEDADTLFFHRQLRTSGDTELGLHLKNFLDGLDPESLPYHRTIDLLLRRGIAIADAVEKTWCRS